MMSKFLGLLYGVRYVVLVVMVVSSLVNLFLFQGGRDVFWGVLLGQLWFGQCFYSFVSGREIVFSAGGGVGKDSNPYVRGLMGVVALFVYVMLFFFKGY
ncbi:hypothetical protein [Pseudomonas sp. TCU-HL1]|uniref:hypothetical protein n=1 Tax=Pseudomonas sp. TCU-HL1 TaxID=1856685 RepID=UPI0011AB5EB5|nr:hypothetical protein [Pseudomonas sp. TCU-HL1]